MESKRSITRRFTNHQFVRNAFQQSRDYARGCALIVANAPARTHLHRFIITAFWRIYYSYRGKCWVDFFVYIPNSYGFCWTVKFLRHFKGVFMFLFILLIHIIAKIILNIISCRGVFYNKYCKCMHQSQKLNKLLIILLLLSLIRPKKFTKHATDDKNCFPIWIYKEFKKIFFLVFCNSGSLYPHFVSKVRL